MLLRWITIRFARRWHGRSSLHLLRAVTRIDDRSTVVFRFVAVAFVRVGQEGSLSLFLVHYAPRGLISFGWLAITLRGSDPSESRLCEIFGAISSVPFSLVLGDQFDVGETEAPLTFQVARTDRPTLSVFAYQQVIMR